MSKTGIAPQPTTKTAPVSFITKSYYMLNTLHLLNEGKTKLVYEATGDNANKVWLIAKDDITAGDGAKHDIIVGKAQFANKTACNVFRLLQKLGIAVAFDHELDPIETVEGFRYGFQAPACIMLPYEVVVRGEAHGSYLKRKPMLEKGRKFAQPIIEFFLKTKDRKWKDYNLVYDDPLMRLDGDGMIHLFNPSEPDTNTSPAKPFLSLPKSEVFTFRFEEYLFCTMKEMACVTFLFLRESWLKLERNLVDFKVEFGIDRSDKLLLADVIDNDSWRVLMGDEHISKEVYRQGGDLATVTQKYREVAELTDRFLP